MTSTEQRQQFEAFLAMHRTPPILVLPNAWDVASARLFEVEGFGALATTSAGLAASLGFPDGEQIGLSDTVALVQRIVARVNVPLSADIEAGYSEATAGVVAAARAVMQAGAVGLNLEDGTGDPSAPLLDPSVQAERITALREMAENERTPLVLNARIDVYLVPGRDPREQLRHTIQRAHVYRQAGADCIFVPTPLDAPGKLDREAIATLVQEIEAPLNLLGGAVTQSLAELEELGVARVSFGPGPMRATLALLRRIARELRDTGTYDSIMAQTIPYAEVNGWFER